MKLELPDFYPPFRSLSVDETGRIFVHASELDEEGRGSVYEVFDPEGKFITKIYLVSMPQVWKNNRLYMIERNGEGFQFIKRYKVTWKD